MHDPDKENDAAYRLLDDTIRYGGSHIPLEESRKFITCITAKREIARDFAEGSWGGYTGRNEYLKEILDLQGEQIPLIIEIPAKYLGEVWGNPIEANTGPIDIDKVKVYTLDGELYKIKSKFMGPKKFETVSNDTSENWSCPHPQSIGNEKYLVRSNMKTGELEVIGRFITYRDSTIYEELKALEQIVEEARANLERRICVKARLCEYAPRKGYYIYEPLSESEKRKIAQTYAELRFPKFPSVDFA